MGALFPARPLAAASAATSKQTSSVGSTTSSETPPVSASWRQLARADAAALNFEALAPDTSVVTPIAAPNEAVPFEPAQTELDRIAKLLPDWAPGRASDPLQAIRSLLAIPAAADLEQMPIEAHLPLLVFEHLQTRFPPEELLSALTWIALHPAEGEIPRELESVGLPFVTTVQTPLRERISGYAAKLAGRMIGQWPRPEESAP
jgi:hypothetical protein